MARICCQLVVNGEVLARYGDAPAPDSTSSTPSYVSTAEFSLTSSPLQLRGGNTDPVSYTVVEGETLQSIARAVLGDANLWYTIAQANGLTNSASLSPGQVLSIPKTLVSANNSSTFKPYDPTQVRGDTNPVLPDLVMPSGGGGGDSCGGLGQILMTAIAIVVAVYSAGTLAAAGTFGSSAAATAATSSGLAMGAGAGTFGATMAAGGAVLGGSAGLGAAVAAGTLSSALGSVASQGFGMVTGMQSDFNWSAVGLAAISGGVGAGMGALGSGTGVLSGNTFGMTAARAAVGSALTQGIAVATGLQQSFDWSSVAASAVGAGVGYGMNANLPTNMNPYVRAGIASFAAGTAAAVARGGTVSIRQVATDVFGQSLASAFVDNMGRAGTQEERLVQTSQESFRASEINAQNPQGWQASSTDLTTGDFARMDGAGYRGEAYVEPFAGNGLPLGRYASGELGSGMFGIDLPVSDQVRTLAAEAEGGRILTQMRDADIDANKLATVTVGKGQGVLAALGAAGYTSAEAKAYYGQMLASGQIGSNGVVQPGQELNFVLDDFSQSKLGGGSIAMESANRVVADLAAQRKYLDRNDAPLRGWVEGQFAAGRQMAQMPSSVASIVATPIDRGGLTIAAALGGEFSVLAPGLPADIASGYAGPARSIADQAVKVFTQDNELKLGAALYAGVGGNVELTMNVNISKFERSMTEVEWGLGVGFGAKGKAGWSPLSGKETTGNAPLGTFYKVGGGQADGTGAISMKSAVEISFPTANFVVAEGRAGVQSPLNGVPVTDKNFGGFYEGKIGEYKVAPTLQLGATAKVDVFNNSYKKAKP